ncbi:MAG: YbhB/YbcL family Raf kinase inhibitor-like protein [Anaerolineae bacterium]|nr:YbhB/YbcL family Raf kinase inhibitor-like protein [Anaerolineae bacterium]
MVIRLSSSAFEQGHKIPPQYTCDGVDDSPPLQWEHVPSEAISLALICDDPDAPAGTWTHWLVYNIPPEIQALPEGVPMVETLSFGAHQGMNSFRRIGYGGPCPPRGNSHRYFVKLYALDRKLDLQPGASKQQVEAALAGHVVGEGQLMGVYQRG